MDHPHKEGNDFLPKGFTPFNHSKDVFKNGITSDLNTYINFNNNIINNLIISNRLLIAYYFGRVLVYEQLFNALNI